MSAPARSAPAPGWWARNWFLVGLGGAVLLAVVYPGGGERGGLLRLETTGKFGIAAIFLLQGLGLSLAALRAGLGQWRVHGIVQGFVFLVLPLLGLCFDAWVGPWLPPALRLGFLYLAVLPSTVSSAVVFASLAGGNTAAALFNATVSTLGGVAVTTSWAGWLLQATGEAPPLGPILGQLLLLLLVPLAVGLSARHWLGAWADRRKRLLGQAGSAFILVLVYGAFCDSVRAGLLEPSRLPTTLIAVAGSGLLFAVATGLAWGTARWAGLARADAIVVLFSAPQKSLASGVPLAQLLFAGRPDLGVILLPILIYHPLQLLVGGVLVSRLQKAQEPKPPPASR